MGIEIRDFNGGQPHLDGGSCAQCGAVDPTTFEYMEGWTAIGVYMKGKFVRKLKVLTLHAPKSIYSTTIVLCETCRILVKDYLS